MGRPERGPSPSSSSSSSKRRRRNEDYATTSRRKHLYLVLDDWKDGYSIHKLDAENMPLSRRLSESAVLRLVAPVLGDMAFTFLGTNIFVDTNRWSRGNRASPTFVYNTENASLTLGPRVPDEVYNLWQAMAVGEKLYAVTSDRALDSSPAMQVLSWAPTYPVELEPWTPSMDWSWNSLSTPWPINGIMVVSYALHPDGHTLFMSTKEVTHSFDTWNGVWGEIRYWVLPFRGQAYYDADLDAWVGLHCKEDCICCCPVASQSDTVTPLLECTMLKENLFHSKEEAKPNNLHLKPTLTYLGDSRFCLVENILCGQDFHDGSIIHVTLFGLKYDSKGELKTKVHRTTRSYAVSKNSRSSQQYSGCNLWNRFPPACLLHSSSVAAF